MYMPNLVKLNLDSNSIMSVSAKHFQGLESLEELGLAGNMLISIDFPPGIHGLQSLNLTLSDQLKDLPDLSGVRTLGSVTVYIPQNAVTCGVSLCWVLLGKNPAVGFLNTTCVDPLNGTVVDWNGLSANALGCIQGKIIHLSKS